MNKSSHHTDLTVWNDIDALKSFYHSALGHRVRQIIGDNIKQIWPDLRGNRLLGMGYAPPYLSLYQNQAERLIAFMPQGQGAVKWPPNSHASKNKGNLSLLGHEASLPFADHIMDRILCVHLLESTEHFRQMMRELWRVLSDDGRLIIIVPNRHGLWAHFDHTPFGAGRPFSLSQINQILCDTMFTPYQHRSALFMPPTHSRFLQRLSPLAESFGQKCAFAFGGITIIEAKKQIYALPNLRLGKVKKRQYFPLPQGGFSRQSDE